ncbi:hypothetical protein SEPB62_19076 [Salmonella enterica subsp. enterica serovar Paratyphi B str. SARA62]|uniref:Uncharacterized protein n=3 Tax=Salmonella enterica TaxID=28901 RepID=A0A753ZBT8_SALER|nr:antA/AntB antirepressor family protein [Salmonella enterica]ECK9403492.1 hypothetical protein [Salmonella enterica subsp. enterica serovar Paratyphi C str. CFSAN000603]QUZ43905.1 antA/AntB antirepressor family protein [Salmonella enterica subsp. enterica serovar Paratyphi B str. CFSAN000549]HAB6612433.1 hypothetical protein [Salmonella enterica subsp. enterica serovar Paratyphi C]HAE8363014.1 hypothetical protein [Salmonella enterica subsp. enterica serovar Paratyphi B]ESE73123.1 hypothetic
MTKQERKNKYDVNTIEKEQMIVDCHMTEEQAETIIAYRNKFKMLEGDDSVLVSLEQLWEVIGSPYGRFQAWLDQSVVIECEKLLTEISVKRLPTKGRPKNNHFITSDAAKHLAMMASTEEGRLARRYFIVMEKLFKEVCLYNHLRIQIEQNAKDVSYQMGFKFGDHKLGGIMKERHNKLVKIINGKRNKFQTNLNKSLEIGEYVKNLMLNGFSDTQIVQMLSH